MIMDWREALACVGRMAYFVAVAGIIISALALAGCGYCKPGVGGNTPGGKTAAYCTNEAGQGP